MTMRRVTVIVVIVVASILINIYYNYCTFLFWKANLFTVVVVQLYSTWCYD